MNFYNTQIGKILTEIKIAYLSQTAIVYIPTDQKELIKELVNGQFTDGAIIPRLTYDNTSKQLIACNNFTCAADNYFWNVKITETDLNTKLNYECPHLFIYTTTSLKSVVGYLNAFVDYFKYPKYTASIDQNAPYRKHSTQERIKNSLVIVNTPFEEKVPGEIAAYTQIIRVPQLSDEEIECTFWSELHKCGITLQREFISSIDLQNIIANLRGFSSEKIKKLVKIMVLTNSIDDSAISWNKVRKILLDEKKRSLDKSISLHWEDIEASDAIGLGKVQQWISERSYIFCDPKRATQMNADIPKGILISGIPGSGKSLMAKQVARELNLPLISMDMAAMRGGVVGESEHNMIRELKLAESMSPCVLWIDEIEKALSGSSSANGDSGVAQRMFGKFLTWMQEKKDACFVFATSNDVTSLPPELFRSERFDSKYYTFLPSAMECAKIFTSQIISANKRHKDKLASMRDIEKDSEYKLVFDEELEDERVWLEILNGINDPNLTLNKYKRKNPDGSEIDVHALDASILGPRNVKIFSGSDISAILKVVKHDILKNTFKNRTSIKSDAIFKKDIVLKTAMKQMSDFKPYGETNIKDVVKCYLKLMINQFASATNNEIISLSAFDISNNTYVPDQTLIETLSEAKCTYDLALYYKVISAINYYSPDIIAVR